MHTQDEECALFLMQIVDWRLLFVGAAHDAESKVVVAFFRIGVAPDA